MIKEYLLIIKKKQNLLKFRTQAYKMTNIIINKNNLFIYKILYIVLTVLYITFFYFNKDNTNILLNINLSYIKFFIIILLIIIVLILKFVFKLNTIDIILILLFSINIIQLYYILLIILQYFFKKSIAKFILKCIFMGSIRPQNLIGKGINILLGNNNSEPVLNPVPLIMGEDDEEEEEKQPETRGDHCDYALLNDIGSDVASFQKKINIKESLSFNDDLSRNTDFQADRKNYYAYSNGDIYRLNDSTEKDLSHSVLSDRFRNLNIMNTIKDNDSFVKLTEEIIVGLGAAGFSS